MKKQEKSLPCSARSRAILPTLAALAILSAYGCGGSSSDDGTDPVDQASQNCAAGTITVNGVTFSYDAFNHEETQNVASTQEGDYENTTSTDTLLCDDGSVSSQGNFNQETTENELGADLTNHYLSQELGYTQITDASVTPEFWEVNSSNELSFVKPLGDYSVFQTTDLTPSYVVVLENAPAQTKPHVHEGEYSQNDSFLTSQINPNQNEANISQVITHPITKSAIAAKTSQISANLQAGVRGAMHSFISTLDPRQNDPWAKILTDGVDYTISFNGGTDIFELNSTNRNLYRGEVNLFTDNSTQIPTRLYLTQEADPDNLDAAEKFPVSHANETLSMPTDTENRFLTTGALNEGEMYRLVDGDGVLYGSMKILTIEESCEQDETKRWSTVLVASGICTDR